MKIMKIMKIMKMNSAQKRILFLFMFHTTINYISIHNNQRTSTHTRGSSNPTPPRLPTPHAVLPWVLTVFLDPNNLPYRHNNPNNPS
jgi:hypothetical protein